MSTKNYKVTLLTKEYPPNIYGGAGVFVGHLSHYLSHLLEVEVRAFGDKESYFLNKNLLLSKYYSEIDFQSKFKNILEALLVSTKMADSSADLVHSITWYTSFGAFLMKFLYGIPCVVTPASLELMRPWRCDIVENEIIISSFIEKLCLQNADHVVAQSKEQMSDLCRLYGLNQDKVSVVHQGVDTESFKPVSSDKLLQRLKISKNYILFIGRITKQKGIEQLFDLIEVLESSIDFVFCFGKADDSSYEKHIQSLVKNSSRNNNIIITGEINYYSERDLLVELYSNACCLIVPSIYEPFGIVNIEAMSCGSPVIASNTGGMKDIVTDGYNGYLVDFNDPKNVAKIITNMINNTLQLERMSNYSRNFVVKNFDWKFIAEKYKQIYDKVINDR